MAESRSKGVLRVKTRAPKTTYLFLSLMSTFVVATSTPAAVFQRKSPFDGTWIANISKSKRHPNHLFKSAALTFTVSDGIVTLSYRGVNMSGAEEKGITTFHPDGKEHPLEGLPGGLEVSRWLTPRILKTVATKDGKVIGQSTFEVSGDGKTLTANLSGTDASGAKFEQVIVCDRE